MLGPPSHAFFIQVAQDASATYASAARSRLLSDGGFRGSAFGRFEGKPPGETGTAVASFRRPKIDAEPKSPGHRNRPEHRFWPLPLPETKRHTRKRKHMPRRFFTNERPKKSCIGGDPSCEICRTPEERDSLKNISKNHLSWGTITTRSGQAE